VAVGSGRTRKTPIFNFREIFIPVERYPFVAPKKDRARRRILARWNNAPGLSWVFLGETGHNGLASPSRDAFAVYCLQSMS